MNLTFVDEKHQYFLDEKPIPSVTQILGLANLYEFVNAKLMDRASKFGTAVHKATELYDLGRLDYDSLDAALMPYLEAWIKFLNDTGFKIECIEEKIYSQFGYAGTLDRIGYLNGKLTLLDIKTTTSIMKTNALQLAAYKNAWQEMHDKTIDQIVCVQLKPLKYSMKKYNDPNDFMMFLQFLNVYKWVHND